MTPAPLGILRWVLFVSAVAAGAYLLNDAIFSARLAGDPVSEHKLGWERRTQASLALSFACFFAAAFLFRALDRLPKSDRLIWLFAALAALLALAPLAAREILIDRCLDGAGRWNPMSIECEHYSKNMLLPERTP
ncbi:MULTISPECIES: hypothetical protein [Methylomonas]|uniref:hypothetical protein n=1 Tax=Methylomonas TaxID=416 RepID=UPI00123187AF|nr:hypothetical protein [Methylomonas rhizoryzae]